MARNFFEARRSRVSRGSVSDHYGYGRRDLESGLHWLEQFARADIWYKIEDLFREHFGMFGELRLVMDPIDTEVYVTPDETAIEYKQSRGVMSPRCFVELGDSGWWQNFGPDELEWEFVDDPNDAEYCILKSDYDRGREDEWRVIDDVDEFELEDFWNYDDYDKAKRESVFGRYLFFDTADEIKSVLDVDYFVPDSLVDDMQDGIDEWIEEIEAVLAGMGK